MQRRICLRGGQRNQLLVHKRRTSYDCRQQQVQLSLPWLSSGRVRWSGTLYIHSGERGDGKGNDRPNRCVKHGGSGEIMPVRLATMFAVDR